MPTATETPTYGGWLELSRRALRHNLDGLARLARPAEIMAVVKANAYGAGAVGVARALRAGGVRRFAVATVDEALALRAAGIDDDILCLTYFDRGDADAIRSHDLTMTVRSPASAAMLADMAGKTDRGGARRRAWIKVDTGLGRLGVPAPEAAAFIEGVRADARLEIAGVYSTLTESRACDRRQLETLVALRDAGCAPGGALWSLASSHGLLTLPESVLDVVRPGIALLGFPPSAPQRLDAARLATADPMPVITWKARVAGVRNVPAGQPIGYGEKPASPRARRVAALSVGWANGYHATVATMADSAADATADCESGVLIGGRRAAVIELSANTTLVDVTGNTRVREGDEAVLLGVQHGAEIGFEALARSGRGVYRMLAGIPESVPRIWSP